MHVPLQACIPVPQVSPTGFMSTLQECTSPLSTAHAMQFCWRCIKASTWSSCATGGSITTRCRRSDLQHVA